MSVLKLTKNDIVRNDENKDKIKLKKSDIFYNPIMESVDTETTTSESSWEKYKEFANSEEGSQGWQKYLADQEASKQKAEAEKEDEKWWETLGRWLGGGGAVDTSLPMGTATQTIHSIRDTGLSDHTTPKDDWSDEQRNIFGYLYVSDPSKASDYAREVNISNLYEKEKADIEKIQDSATSSFGAGVGHTLGAIATAPVGGMADFLNDLVMSSAGVPISRYDGQVSPFEYSQAVTGGISEHLNEKGGTLNENIPIIGGKGWGDVYGLGTSIAQSAISGYTLGGAGTLVSYFGQGAASGVDDALSRGASEEQAILYGTVLGVAEGLAEQIGIDNLFKLGASPTLKVAIKNMLKQAGAEGLEEGLTSIISNIADNAIMQDQSNFNAMVKAYMEQGMTEAKAKQKAWMDSIEGIAYDTLGGFVSGGVHAGAHTGIKTAIDNHNASNMYGDSVQDLLAEAVDIGGEAANVADKHLAKYEKRGKLSGADLNELVYTNEQELRTQDKAKIKSVVEAKLTEYGETGDVSAIADVLVKQASGEKLTSKEINLLNQSKAGHQVSGELNSENLKSGGLANDWAADIGTERINADVYNRELYDLAQQKVTTEGSSASKTEGSIEPKFKVSESGNTTINGEEASIKEISSVKDGEITLRLENGETVSANDVEFSSSDEMLYATVVDMNLNAETANAFIRGFNATEGLTAEQYALGFREAYRYGSYGFPVQEMSRDGFSASLSESQKSLAYGLGKVNAKYETEAKQKAVKDAKVTNKIEANSMSIEEAEKVAGLTDRQKTSIKGLKALTKSLGVNVRFFESKVGENGKRIGANGWYDPKTGIVYIDLHAGLNGEGTILFTAAHELTHHIREWSPAKFKVFADFLLENYGKKGVSVDALVRAQMEKAQRNGREISYDTACEEVIADSCEMMLADGDAIAKIAKLKAKDRSLWEKIKNFITDLVAKIKEAYKGLKPDSVEGKLVGEMLDVAEQLKALWTEALVDAGDNYKSAEKVLAESGIVVNSDTESASLLSVRDVLSDDQRKKVSSALATRFGVTQQEAMDWLKAETSMASLILNPKYSQYLDYTPDPNEVAIKQNSDYPQGTVDFSPICAKRREFTSVMNNILRIFPNHVFAATDLAKIRSIMQEEGMTIPCGICYVEDRRQLDTIVAQNFIDSLKLYREGSKTRPDGKAFNTNQLKGLSLTDGDSYTPSVYELVSLEGLNVLREKNPNMAEAWVKFNNARGMQSVRLLANEAEYKRQILKYSKQTVKSKNDKGGLRVYSFSDAEMFHLIDIIQVITDSATVGLSLQGYTKVNEYARAVKDTGEKLNRSLIPKGELGYHIEDGKVVLDYDTVEGIDINHPDFFDNRDNPNVGNITIGVSDVQIRAAMVSDFVDQIIPFHTGQSEDVLGEKGIATWSNYKDFQTEKDIATGKVSDHQINIYTEVLQELEKEGKPITKRTFVEKFLQVAKENNLTPRFSQFLNTNEKGEYVYTEGYHKMLVDFKTFAQTEVGEYLPQMPVKPIFDNEYITKILKDYVKSQKVKDAEFTKSMPKVIERITNEIVKPGEVKLSDRDSLGNELSAEQQEFFKDSKVRDKKGNLMVLYHGTTANFNTFKKGDVGFHFGTKGAARGRVGFGKNVTLKEVYLNITNPIVFDEDLGSWDADFRLTRELYDRGILTQAEAESVLFTDNKQYKRTTEAANKKLASVLLEKGYDGIAYSNTFETKKATTSYIVFNSNQAKEITNKAPTSNPDIRYSDRDSYAPTFYSYMGKVIDGVKLEKMGANGVVSYLKGKGVKDEEIKWSGIEAFLEGKKSVTKAELQEFVAGSQLQIQEQASSNDIDLRYNAGNRSYSLYDEGGNVIDTYTYNEFIGGYVSHNDEEIYSNSVELEDALREEYGVMSAPRWADYKLDGGENYRELVFIMPNSSYNNRAMRAHWGQEAEGVLAHARIQDMTTADGKKMLFIEEIQSDWHNEGQQKGYTTKEYEEAVEVYDKLAEDYANKKRAFNKYVRSGEFRSDPDEVSKKKFDWLRGKMDTAEKRMQDAERDIEALKAKGMGDVPDAPFRNNYHEYVLKRLLRMAAEEGYDSIGWTPADIQSQRWSSDYAEGYRIEYDQDIPKFLRKYGKKWGATVGKTPMPNLNRKETYYDVNREETFDSFAVWQDTVRTTIDQQGGDQRNVLFRVEGDDWIAYDKRTNIEYDRANVIKTSDSVWSMDITGSMKDSVLHEGQVLFSDRDNTPNEFNPDGKTLDEQLDDILHTAESYDGRYIYIGRFTPEFISMVSQHTEIKDLPIAMNYRDAYLSMESKEHGKYKGEGINYHDLGKEGLKSAIESFESPEQVLLSKTNGKVELILEGVDRKGNKLLSIVALNTVAKNGKKYIEAHIVTSIYGRRNIERYINKAEQEGRLIYNKKEELTQVNPQVQYEGIINANSSANSVAQSEENVKREFSDADTKYSIREEAPPKKTKEGYKVFVVKNGKLYPPMVANPNAEDTPVGVWLNADVGTRAADTKTGRPQVKAGGKGTQGGSGSLAFRPGWHLGETPLATQFDRLNPETGVKELFPENFVWALCDIAADHDYQEEAMSYGYTKNGKFQHSLAGLPKLPTDGFYKYRTNPNPDTVPWLITGAMKVKKLLSDAEVNAILESKGLSPKRRVGGDKTLEDLGLSEYEGKVFSDRDTDSVSNRSLLANALESVAQNDIEKTKLTQYKQKIALIESEQKKLAEIRAKIKELSFAKGARDTKAIKDLQFEANQIANRINTYDKQLLGLESTKALKGVLEREKALLRKRLEQKGKESLAAYREKATKTQRELLTRYQDARKNAVEGRNKTAMRHKIKNVVSDLNKLLLHPTKEQHVPIGLQKVVADALDAINMDTMNAEERVKYYNDLISKSSDPDEIKMLTKKRDFFEYRDMNFKDRITALKNAYAEFKESDDPLIRNAHNDAIADLISNTASAVGNTSLKDMSLDQLEAVYDMYKAVLATVRNANKMFKEGRQETVTENSESVKVQVKEAGGHQDRVLKLTKFLKKAGWDMLKPVTAMKVIGSKTLAGLFDNVRAAEDTWAVDVREAKEFYEGVSKKYGYDKWDFKTQHNFKDSRGEEYSISLEQMLSLYAYSKRAQADEHLEFGGFIFDDSIEVTERKGKFGIPLKYEVNDANPHRLGVIQVMEIIDKLTPDQRAFVDEMQAYLSDVMGAKGNEVSLALYDIKLYKEKNYFPLKTARYFREFDPEKSGTPKIKNSGFSKKTVPQAGNPIVLSNFMDVWASHVNDMSMYHAFVLPLEDFMRVYNYSSTAGGYDSVQQYIKNAYGSQANQYIERLMDDLNGGARVDSSASPINKGISLFKKASVFASASVVIQQPSAIARALAYINPKYFATSAGSALNLKKHKAVWEEIKKYAPVAVIKEMGYFDTGMGRSTVEWIKGNKTIKDKMDDVLSKAPAKADELSWSYIWLAVKKEIQATTNLTPGSEEFFKKTSDRFTEVITNTQVYDSVLSRSGMMRSKDTGMKMATAFMAEPTTTVNMMVDGIIQGKRGNKKFTASTVGAISASIILNSILVALVYAARDDDEDETYIEKYVGSLTSELLDGFNPLTYIPFVKDGWSLAQGYDVERSDLTVVSDLIDTIDKLFNEDKSGWEKVSDATGAVSSLFGIPLKNLIRDAKGMYNLTKTILSGTPTTGAGISESIRDAFTSSIPLWDRLHDSDSKSDKLYKAMLSGDQAHISRIKSGYASEQDFEAAMRQALRENDSRIQEAAMAVMSGKGSERVRIQKEIIAEGHFKQDYVIEATNAEIQYVRTKIKEANEFTRKGKDSEADKIYESLLARGYSEEFLDKLIK